MANQNLNSTKREIHGTMELMEQWGLFKYLQKSEKERIHSQLNIIAKAAINDFKNVVANVGNELYSDLK